MERKPSSKDVHSFGRASSVSVPLLDTQVYRPGPYFALLVLLLPLAVTLAIAAIVLNSGNAIPIWLPFVLLLWLPAIPVIWLLVKTVRTTSQGIATGRPWRMWNEIPWDAVERADQRGLVIRLVSIDGRSISFLPILLQGGGYLERQMLLKLPPHVFGGRLARKGQVFLWGDKLSVPETHLTGTMFIQPQSRWYVLLIVTAIVSAGCAGIALAFLPFMFAIPVSALCVIITLVMILLAIWLLQTVSVNEDGVEVQWRLPRRTSGMQWDDIEMVEHSSRQALIRLRGTYRILCAGPTLMNPSQCMLFRAFLNAYCTDRDIPIIRRPWLR
jgi:hypothetical protein